MATVDDWVDMYATPRQMAEGCLIGTRRHRSQRDGGGALIYADGRTSNLVDHIAGGRGEKLIADKLHLPWNKYVAPPEELQAWLEEKGNHPDVGDDIEVKVRKNLSYNLPIRFTDNPEWRYLVLILRLGGRFVFKGWLYGYEGMNDEFIVRYPKGHRKAGMPKLDRAWTPPDELLRPPRTLAEWDE